LSALTEKKIEAFANHMALIVRDTCVAAEVDDNMMWTIMAEYKRQMSSNYKVLHTALTGGSFESEEK